MSLSLTWAVLSAMGDTSTVIGYPRQPCAESHVRYICRPPQRTSTVRMFAWLMNTSSEEITAFCACVPYAKGAVVSMHLTAFVRSAPTAQASITTIVFVPSVRRKVGSTTVIARAPCVRCAAKKGNSARVNECNGEVSTAIHSSPALRLIPPRDYNRVRLTLRHAP